MKKIYIYAAILAAVLSASSCSKDVTSPVEASRSVTFTASISEDTETRTTIGENTGSASPVLWSENDSISVMTTGDDQINAKFVLADGAGSANASFTGDCSTSSESYYAIYPYNKANRIDVVSGEYAPYVYWNGAEQIAHKGTSDPAKSVMVACATPDTDGKVSFSFRNAMAYVKFTTNYKCKTVTFESNNSVNPIACKAFREGGMESGGVPVFYPAVEEGTSTITLKAADDGVIEAGTYYIAILPQQFPEGFKITFTSEYHPLVGKYFTYSKSTDKSVQIMRRHALDLGTFDLVSNLAYPDGSGIDGEPYMIEDFAQLEFIRDRVNEGDEAYVAAHYMQVADIDMSDRPVFTPIGNNDHMFAGNYNGNFYKISNITYGYFTGYKTDETGLFGNLYIGTIRNLTVENPAFSGSGDGKPSNFGIICSHAYSDEDGEYECHILNCRTKGAVSYGLSSDTEEGGMAFGGGILGVANANIEIKGCVNECVLDPVETRFEPNDGTHPALGGIVGYAGPVKTGPGSSSGDANALVRIDRCRNAAKLVIWNHFEINPSIGGIIGMAYDYGGLYYQNVAVHISNCVNSGSVSLAGQNLEDSVAGGIVGLNESDGFFMPSPAYEPEIFNCLNKGDIRSDGNGEDGAIAAGIVAESYDEDTDIIMCVNLGSFIRSYSTLLIGEINYSGGTVTDCFGKDSGKTADELNALLSSSYSDRDAAQWVENSGELDLDF